MLPAALPAPAPLCHAGRSPDAMKLGSIRVDNPQDVWDEHDGRLAVVDDRNGRLAVVPRDVAGSLFTAIQSWSEIEPKLREIDAELKQGRGDDVRDLDAVEWMAPLPRTTSWLDGSAFIQHIKLVRQARGAEVPETLRKIPLMYQGCSDPLYGPDEPIVAVSEEHGIDFEAEVGIITDGVPMGTRAEEAEEHIQLLCLINDVSLRGLIPDELKRGFGFFHGKPPSHFAPFVVTKDEVEGVWKDGRLHLDMLSWRNGDKHGDPDAGPEMFFSFHDLVAHAARTRPLPAGTVIGSGTVSNEDTSRGSSCLAEKRMLEIIETGEATTPFLRFGDRVRIDMHHDGRSLFGAIDQEVVRHEAAKVAADPVPARS